MKKPGSPAHLYSERKYVRLGLIGLGNMGQTHAGHLLAGSVRGLRLSAVADLSPERRAQYSQVPGFATDRELLSSGLADAVLIATPHYHHTSSGLAALKAGLHVLIEKPISVHRRDCERLIAAHRDPRQVFAAVFNQRTDPLYQKLRHWVQSGKLGPIRRVAWTVTDWFRSAAYYASGGWRATWAGEGGGVLLNQCPHNLDLFQWIFGQPRRVHGFCRFGRYHDIEVEDDVTAYFELPGGAHATFITSTGEAPGSNRLEIVAENGRLVVENRAIHFTRNRVPMSEFNRTTPAFFEGPATRQKTVVVKDTGPQHVGILRNFAAAILRGEPLIAPAAEGIHSVELANAILLSSWTGAPVDLPLDAATYARWLKKKIASSRRAGSAEPGQRRKNQKTRS